ncbi:MAG: hypothetical protein ACNA71_00550 [Kiritimatiellia bacterium]
MKRIGLVVLLALGVACESAIGSVRVASVYLESFAALQTQAEQAAQIFESPEIGTLPMMMQMMVPGLSQIDRDAPVALHIYSDGAEKYSVVLDIKPAVSAENFLAALVAAQGGHVPDAVDGRFVTEQGAAQVHGDRLLLGQQAADLDVSVVIGIPAEMPGIAGLLRLDAAPATLAKMLDGFAEMLMQTLPADDEHRAMFRNMIKFYRAGLEQVAIYQSGIGVTGSGLEIRGKIVPQAGRALAGIVQSLQGVDAAWLSQLNRGNLFGAVSGAYTIPEGVLASFVDLYIDMLRSVPDGAELDPELMRAMFEPSIASAGAPSFLFAGLREGSGKLDLSGGMLVADAASVLKRMMALVGSDAYQQLMAKSGMAVSGPVERLVNGHTVYRWSMTWDGESLRDQMGHTGAPGMGADEMATFTRVLEALLGGYDYAATDKGMVFGITDDAGIIQAMQLLDAGGQRMAAPNPVLARMGVSTAPYAVARLDLLGMLKLVSRLTPSGAAFAQIESHSVGIQFTGWRSGDAIEQMITIPASDIRAMRKTVQAMQ